MAANTLYKFLDYPFVYQLVQTIFAPGGEFFLRKKIKKQLVSTITSTSSVLDVGCGPASWLWHEDVSPVGFDLSFAYAKAFVAQNKGDMVVGSAGELPFRAGTFSGVWTIGLLHHMSNADVRHAVREMLRVCCAGGKVIIMDAVFPEISWLRPLAYFIRRMDRGKFMRYQSELLTLLPDQRNWRVKRYTYAATGLEMLECSYLK